MDASRFNSSDAYRLSCHQYQKNPRPTEGFWVHEAHRRIVCALSYRKISLSTVQQHNLDNNFQLCGYCLSR